MIDWDKIIERLSANKLYTIVDVRDRRDLIPSDVHMHIYLTNTSVYICLYCIDNTIRMRYSRFVGISRNIPLIDDTDQLYKTIESTIEDILIEAFAWE